MSHWVRMNRSHRIRNIFISAPDKPRRSLNCLRENIPSANVGRLLTSSVPSATHVGCYYGQRELIQLVTSPTACDLLILIEFYVSACGLRANAEMAACARVERATAAPFFPPPPHLRPDCQEFH